MLTALIDSDTPLYGAAASAEDQELWVATSRLDRTIENLLSSVDCTDYKLFVSGKGNFRKDIDPSYKANRTAPTPRWREACKQHLIDKWGAIEAHGCEADDYCGIYQTTETIICGIDKDLLQIPGKHYSWEIVRKGTIVRPAMCFQITEFDALKNFYKQLLTGDTSDNIKGIDGIGPKTADKLIDPLTSEEAFRDVVMMEYATSYSDGYLDGDALKLFKNNADLLWIMRDVGVTYTMREMEHYD